MQAPTRNLPGDPHRLHDSASTDLASRVQTTISRKVFGQVRDLQVYCQDGIVVVRGRTRTHHAKQLAHEAALNVAGSAVLTNQIVVTA